MQTDKLNFFDLFAFFIPGGTFLHFLYFLVKPMLPLVSYSPNTDSTFILVPYVCGAYFVGHVISALLGRPFAKKVLSKNAHVLFLAENPAFSQKLDIFNQQTFQESFFDDKNINTAKAKMFYDRLHHQQIDVNRDSTEHVLFAQMVFFRNINALLLASIVAMLGAISYRYYGLHWSNNKHWTLFAGLFFALYISTLVMKDRQKTMIETIYRTFLTPNFSRDEHQETKQ